MPNWEKIQNEWETTKKTYKELEEQFDVKSSTIRSRKNREKWERNATTRKRNTVATKKKSVATKNEIKEPVVISDNLTDKQRLFCIYYIKYFNATKAYQKAYECAYTTAMVEGHRHLRNPKINLEIDRMKEEQTSGLKLGVRDVLQKYIDIAFADITDFVEFGKKEVPMMSEFGPLVDEKGNEVMQEVNYVDFRESAQIDGTIITEVKQGRDGVSVKLADKMRALDMLAKYTDLLSDNDKKRLDEEKVKTEIAKVNIETKKLEEGDASGTTIVNIVDAWSDADE